MGRLIDRFNDAVCHRAFSGPEAWTYEVLVAKGVADVVTPLLDPHASGRVLDVGCGGGTITRRLGAEGVDASVSQARRARGDLRVGRGAAVR